MKASLDIGKILPEFFEKAWGVFADMDYLDKYCILFLEAADGATKVAIEPTNASLKVNSLVTEM